MLLWASLTSTEAAEVWSRVAVAHVTLSGLSATTVHQRPAARSRFHRRPHSSFETPNLTGTPPQTQAFSSVSSDESAPDVPVWTFFDAPALLAPRTAFVLGVVLAPLVYQIGTRGPPAQTAPYILPPLRAPPAA